jgi:hypothetical protein
MPDFNVVDPALGRRNGQAIFAQALKVKLHGLPDLGLHFFDGGTGSNAAWKIWDVGGIVALCLLDHDCVPHLGPHFFRPARQPSSCSIRKTSLTFIEPAYQGEPLGSAVVFAAA